MTRSTSLLFGLALACCCASACAAEHPSPIKGVGLVLGGGGARGLAHMGVIEELERLRIPISCIAGTSAGALVGGVYASGMPIQTLIREVKAADWDHMLTGAPRRADRPYQRKKDDFKNLMDATLGVGIEGIKVPRAALSTQEMDVFLHKVTRDIAVRDFDALPIPFQAVATDLVSGDPFEFTGGDLAIALRSSMAVPGVFDLVELDGHLLVDGMLIRNVPVQNVKGRCADDVIVVDVGTPLLEKKDIRSFVDVADQQSNIYVRLNVRQQLALMGPNDVLIEPDLSGYSAASFGEGKAIIERGRQAVAPVAARLARYQVSEAEYAEWKASLKSRQPEELKPYADVKVASGNFVPGTRIDHYLRGEERSPSNQTEMVSRIESLYATGDFDRVAYSLRDQEGKRVAEITPIERTVGPNYLRFGIDFKLDSYNNSDVAFLGNLQMTWLNRWGAQWRNDVRVGSGDYWQTEFFQPLAHSQFFTSASANFSREKYSLWDEGGRQQAQAEITSREAELGLGYSLGSLGETRVSYFSGYRSGDVVIGPSSLDFGSERGHGMRAYTVIDQFDNPRFPRSGYQGKLDYRYMHSTADGAKHMLNLSADGAHSFGALTVRGTVRLSGNLDPGVSISQFYTLGGFLNLSGYNTSELVGQRTAFFRLMGYKRIVSILPNLGSGMYVGFSAELGRVWKQVFLEGDSPWIRGGSAFVGVDTLLGPLFLAYGQSEGGRRAGYLYLGVSY
jgi:NTE family protein